MQTKLLTKLLEDVIETNRIGIFYAGFRYSVDQYGGEMLALDVFRGGENFMHRMCQNNDDLEMAIKAFKKTRDAKNDWDLFRAGKM